MLALGVAGCADTQKGSGQVSRVWKASVTPGTGTGIGLSSSKGPPNSNMAQHEGITSERARSVKLMDIPGIWMQRKSSGLFRLVL